MRLNLREGPLTTIDMVIQRGVSGEVYNVGTNCEMRNFDLVKTVFKVVGKLESHITFVSDRPGDDRRYTVNAGKISRQLGWKARHRLLDALPEVVRWYQKNDP